MSDPIIQEQIAYYQPDELAWHFSRHGIRLNAAFTDYFFVYASGQVAGS